MKKKLLQIALLIGIMGACFMLERKVIQAADYPTEPYPHGIGKDMEALGHRVIGISYSLDGGLKEYSYDVYNQDTNGDWVYSFTRINDTAKGVNVSNIGNRSAFITVNDRSLGKHYQIHASNLRDALGDFSVVTHCYHKGKEISNRKEYSFIHYSLNMGAYDSVMTHNELSLGSFSAEADSYVYNFYRPRALNHQTEVALQAGEGKLEQGGVAYYTEDGYYIRKLPIASLVKPGYSVKFLGWFDAPEGGKQIQEGTWCSSGTTLYARWETTPISYHVTCYDIAGDNPAGKILGEHTWEAAYGTSVSGKELGNSTDTGAYYKGFTYQGCTTGVVSTSGAIIYRYFAEHHYQISFHGNGATSGKMESIKNCSYTEKISLTKNCFQKEICVTLDGNGDKVTCKTSEVCFKRRFLGWALSPEGEVRYSDGATLSQLTDREAFVTLYAVWSDEKLIVKESPQRFGYEFAGWAVTPEAKNGITQFLVEDNLTLYAVWKPGTASYHVEYYKENLEGHYELVSSYAFEDYVGETVEISAEENIYQGYFLDRQSSVMSGIVRPNGSLILTVFYTRSRNEVSYDWNGGEEIPLPETVEKKYGEELTIWEGKTQKTGYTFGGWSQETDGKYHVYAPGEKIKMPNHKMVLYARWIPISYQIRFDGNGAVEGDGVQIRKYAYDEVIKLPSCTARKSGYEFVNWNTKADGTGISFSCQKEVEKLCDKEGECITLFAQWQPISFEISYVSNVSEEMSGNVKGTVENTFYSFVENSYTAKDTYYIAGFRFAGWNTKADGSGKLFQAGENIVGKIDSRENSILYAMWEPCENIGFQIELMPEGSQEPLDTLQYYGRTGETVATALERIFKDKLLGEDATYFYPGYQVVNAEELDKTIQGDHSTKCYVTIKKRKCTLDYCVYYQGVLTSVTMENDCEFQDKVVLKDSLDYLGKERKVSRYIDSTGNSYLPGQSVSLERNLSLIPQFKIMFQGEMDSPLEEIFVCWGKAYSLPLAKKTGYAFQGWYTKEGERIGTAKDLISGAEDLELYSRWSEPLCYHITYDVEDTVVRILENRVSKYQYLSEVVLPGESQVAVLLDGYEFAGWYLADDEKETVIHKLAAGTCGDVILKAKLVRKSYGESNNMGNHGTGDGEEENSKKPDSNVPENKNPIQTNDVEQDEKNPEQSMNMMGNTGILSQKQDTNQGGFPKKSKEIKAGTVFWKKNIKYKILSVVKGKYRVKVVGNRYKRKQLRIPTKVSYGGKSYRIAVIGKKAFYKNKYIKKIILSSSVDTVENQAFASMKRLSQVSFGKNVRILGKKVFYQDTSLKKVKISSKKIKKIGKKIFGGCKKLRHLSGIKRKKGYFRR